MEQLDKNLEKKKGFIQIPVIVLVIVGLAIAGTASYIGVFKYTKNKQIDTSELEERIKELEDQLENDVSTVPEVKTTSISSSPSPVYTPPTQPTNTETQTIYTPDLEPKEKTPITNVDISIQSYSSVTVGQPEAPAYVGYKLANLSDEDIFIEDITFRIIPRNGFKANSQETSFSVSENPNSTSTGYVFGYASKDHFYALPRSIELLAKSSKTLFINIWNLDLESENDLVLRDAEIEFILKEVTASTENVEFDLGEEGLSYTVYHKD